MVALQIRGVPEDVREALADRARAQGQSLQGFLLCLLQEEARRSRNRALLERFVDRNDGSLLAVEEAAEAVSEAREEREGQLLADQVQPGGDAA